MIDIENAKKEFEKYTNQFDSNEGRIKLKIEHIQRVALMSKKIAKYLKLDEEHIRLAEIIGLFHDIGRFKQVELYDTFSDKDSVNHAELSVKVLFEDNLINNFKIDEKYYRIIRLAVLNHNRDKIQQDLNEEEMLFCKIIRDADKLDIYYTICEYDLESIFWYKDFECESISDNLMHQFKDLHEINYKDIKNNADQIPTFYAFVFDLYFDYSLKYLKEHKYLDKFANRVCEKFALTRIPDQVKEMLDISNKYIN